MQTATAEVRPLYPSRSGAGATLGHHVYERARQPIIVIGVTPTGVEVAASVAKAIGCEFDVIVASHIRLDNLGIVGALAEDADAVLDPEFEPRFGMLDAMGACIERARRVVKRERLLFRGQRPLRSVEGKTVVIVDGHVTSPWKSLAAGAAVAVGEPAHLLVAAPVGTQSVRDRMHARRVDFLCPSVVMDPGGHPRPFGDPGDPSAERLRSIVLAREAA